MIVIDCDVHVEEGVETWNDGALREGNPLRAFSLTAQA